MSTFSQLVSLLAVTSALTSCSNDVYRPNVTPNYDDLVGKKFSEEISRVGQLGFKQVSETNEIREVADKRSDGCTTVFGVRKSDGIIAYWRVTPSPEECKVRSKALNV